MCVLRCVVGEKCKYFVQKPDSSIGESTNENDAIGASLGVDGCRTTTSCTWTFETMDEGAFRGRVVALPHTGQCDYQPPGHGLFTRGRLGIARLLGPVRYILRLYTWCSPATHCPRSAQRTRPIRFPRLVLFQLLRHGPLERYQESMGFVSLNPKPIY